MSGSGLRAGLRSTDRRRRRKAPWEIPQVAAGYWWHPAIDVGLGTAGFRCVEGNGHSSFDLVQATVASQPTLLTENGTLQYRMRRADNANPSIVGTAGAVQAGWTGATSVLGWFRLPDASGDITGSNNLFVHTPSTAGQRRLSVTTVISPSDQIRLSASVDGTATGSNSTGNLLVGGSWRWLKHVVQPNLAGVSPNTERVQASADLVSEAMANVTTLAGLTALFDGAAPVTIASRPSAGFGNFDTTDRAGVYYCNGILSAQDERDLRAWLAPIPVAA